jgi:hypothetical protein
MKYYKSCSDVKAAVSKYREGQLFIATLFVGKLNSSDSIP